MRAVTGGGEGKEMSYQEFTFIKTTYDISLDSQISLLPLGFSLLSGGNKG